MANLDVIAATVKQLLTQTTAFLQQNRSIVVQDEILETLERDTQLAMKQLRRCRNESVPIPINRLPPELLRVVFSHLRPPPSPRRTAYEEPSIEFTSYETLISAMLVCHKWHANASDAASLWTDIDFQRQRTFAPVLLTRSLGAAVHLCGSLTSEDNAFETVIRNNAGRIRELDLWIEGPRPAFQAILALDMPQVRMLCLSYKDTNRGMPASTVLNCTSASFPSIRAMVLQHFLFVPTHVLLQLTHLHLAYLRKIHTSNILDFLRNTPALEVLDLTCYHFITPINLTTGPLPVALSRLQSSCISRMDSADVHCLMTTLEVPSIAFLDLSEILAGRGTLLSKRLLPGALTTGTHTMRRLAFEVDNDFGLFRSTFHGNEVSLSIDLHILCASKPERKQWAFTEFPTMLSLSNIEELHIQAREWEAHQDMLLHLAAHMPAVSTLLIKHKFLKTYDIKDDPGHMALVRTVARVLHSDNPVLFPNLVHLDLIVRRVPLAFFETVACALAHREQDGRRLRKLRLGIDESPSRRQPWYMWPNYKKTGILDHVDSADISYLDDDADAQGLGWGRWKDCVERADHGYWQPESY